ncbi:unnamed protein product [Didymodactylos carnosus]|uniref:FAD-binding domain-containing protein n=1 Tax=Didymodactylos carnosus TaxID=1234261 RepID=A0A815I729_9BILA|nr:unnamed protein product [Didymodactylos carnosus]CAF1364464.1 unnamed protein product [Didymodactylos carnosus]CAF4099969.1 unnamed protein product [Didymodactylos carnosus]CAF4245665.1 unnamed protein product [Didymodactylos carnosus]
MIFEPSEPFHFSSIQAMKSVGLNHLVNDDHLVQSKRDRNTFLPFIWNLKRLAAVISEVAHSKGFSQNEIIELLNILTTQYIETLSKPKATPKLMLTHRLDNSTLKQNMRRSSIHGCLNMNQTNNYKHINWTAIPNYSMMTEIVRQLAISRAELSSQITLLNKRQRGMVLCMETPQIEYQFINDKINYADSKEGLMLTNDCDRKILTNALLSSQIDDSEPLQIPLMIVGGGIGGLATALCFARAGKRVHLLEKQPEFVEVGAGMQLAPNCSRLLDQLGVLKDVQRNAVFPKEIVWMDAISGEKLTGFDLGEKFVDTFGYAYMVVHRGDLLQALYRACLDSSLVTMESSKLIVNIEQCSSSVLLSCADGTRYNCELCVGADGLWSQTRKFVHDDGPPISVGYVTYRGTVPIAQVSAKAGRDNVLFWVGPDMHLVQYPIRRGEFYNQAAVFKSKQQPNETDEWGTTEELFQHFSIGCEAVRNALPLLKTNFRWPVYDREPLTTWSRGRLVLLGDAAHPMLQYAAQGAAQALEDAVALVSAYMKYDSDDIKAIFETYENERINLSSNVVRLAREIGEFAHKSGFEKIARDFLLRNHDVYDYDCLKWLYARKRRTSI